MTFRVSGRKAVVLASFALLIAQAALFRGFTVDDVFITLRYVRQFIHSNGLVYNIGERVEGYSNFLWIIVLAGADLLGGELLLVAKGLGLACALGTLVLTWALARRTVPTAPRFQVLAPWLLVCSAPFAAWAVSGLETAFFTFLLTLAIHAYIREEAALPPWLTSGFLFALAAMARPEGAVLFLATALYRCWKLWRHRARPGRAELCWVGSFVLPYGAYFAWRLAYYSYLFPNTVYAKSLGLHPRAFMEGIFYVYDFIVGNGGWAFYALLIGLAWLYRRNYPLAGYLAFLLAIYTGFIVFSGGDWMPLYRFWVHVLPPLLVMVQAGAHALFQILSESARLKRASGWLVAAMVSGVAVFALLGAFQTRFIEGRGAGPLIPDGGSRVAYLQEHTRPGDTIAVIDAGLIAYRLPLEVRLIDMVGLADAHIAHQPVRFPGGLLARHNAFGKWDVDYVLAQRPLFVQVNVLSGDPRRGPVQTNFTGTTELVNDPRFRADYTYVVAPGVEGLYARRDGQ